MAAREIADFSSGILRLAGGLLAPAGRRTRLNILIYHRVLPAPDPMRIDEIDTRMFDWQMAVLASHFNVLSLNEAVSGLMRGSLPSRPACVTFDDGYADNFEVALPVLRRRNLPATFFPATGYLNGGRMWNDAVIETLRQVAAPELDLTAMGLGVLPVGDMERKRKAAQTLITAFKYLPQRQREDHVARLVERAKAQLPGNLMMSEAQIRGLHNAGMGVGAHTVSHPILASLDPAAARREIADGRDALEGMIGGRVELFAYPNGRPGQDYRAEHVKMVRELGFSAAVTTAWGAGRMPVDIFQLPRFTPWDRTPARFVMRLLRNYRQPVATLR